MHIVSPIRYILLILTLSISAWSQSPPTDSVPIAIVPLDPKAPGSASMVTGALQVSEGRAVIAASGEITSGSHTTEVTLPRRGTLRVCASTTVKLASDPSVSTGEVPGLLMSIDRGAVEASFATGRDSDVLMTPNFRILISGPGAVEVKVRLGEHGDTCVDNPGADAPYVLVSSVFEEGAYRVQPGQRVMFEGGSLHQVVDDEKEPCGCPPPAPPTGNEFPLAQSEGLAPLSQPAPASPLSTQPQNQAQATPPLVYAAPPAGSAASPEAPAQPAPSPAAPQAQPTAQPPAKKQGFFHRLGNFFRRLFGAE